MEGCFFKFPKISRADWPFKKYAKLPLKPFGNYILFSLAELGSEHRLEGWGSGPGGGVMGAS